MPRRVYPPLPAVEKPRKDSPKPAVRTKRVDAGLGRDDAFIPPALAWTRPGSIVLVADPKLIVEVEDWSKVRSPSRAKRRQKKGHPQNVVRLTAPDPRVYFSPDRSSLHAHPSTLARVRAMLAPGSALLQDSALLLNQLLH